MHPMLNIAIRAARSAGNVIAKACGQMDLVQTTQKGTNDFVTNIDKEAEQAIVHVYVSHSRITILSVKRTANMATTIAITSGSSTLLMVPPTLSKAFLTLRYP
jgi:3'-phosphoadenosine 5'-phosphosulfate (PAPS) 3'-phosphatase